MEDHLVNLDKVLSIIATAGLKLNKAKCEVLLPRVEYLGHMIDGNGLHPTKEKVRAIQEAPQPRNASELRSFLGIINYYGKLLPNLSTKLMPLYQLLKRSTRWQWDKSRAEAFEAAKNALQDDTLLVHYDSNRQLVLACDILPYGLGAVLSHIMDDVSATTINASSIKRWTDTDPVLSQVHDFVLQGWPTTQLNDKFQPCRQRKDKLSVLEGCIVWGSRVVVPPPSRQSVLDELHDSHLGASKMKSFARAYIWWPKLDNDIENLARSVQYVNKQVLYHLKLHYIHGSGHHDLGVAYT